MKRAALGVLGVLLAMSLSACVSVGYSYSPMSSAPARPAGCTFEVITTVPQRPFTELGVFEASIKKWVNNLEKFRMAVREDLCKAGADAVVIQVNGYGYYVKGTAIKYKPAPASPASTASTATN